LHVDFVRCFGQIDAVEWIVDVKNVLVVAVHAVGAVQAFHALMKSRTSQGSIAWILSLLTFPYVAVPMYCFFGRDKFAGYVRARRAWVQNLAQKAQDVLDALKEFEIREHNPLMESAVTLGGLPHLKGNSLKLFSDGVETFDALFSAIESAKSYILINYYIFKKDTVGDAMQQALVRKARAGVKVLFLFDEMGSSKLPREFLREMREAGVVFHHFGTNRFWWSRLQYNFRNHRKIVVCDGDIAFIGGLNVADEYLGSHPQFGYWRDTHMKICGPAVLAVQLVFIEDWYWACGEVPDLTYTTEAAGTQNLLILPTGPADVLDSWQLFVVAACNHARQQLWIASPYFVPDGGVVSALQSAALRGVDVRILIPDRSDSRLVNFATYSYYQQIMDAGVSVYRYTEGFLHQKVLLSDDHACVGTGNLDPRSFRLNFEIAGFTNDEEFVSEVYAVLKNDFATSYQAAPEDYTGKPWYFRAACRAARLLSPLL
jgi:cardiolipin synthase A/B